MVLQGCRKSQDNEGNTPVNDNTYIALFKKDSIAGYLGTSVSKDTTGVRSKLNIYMLKILADHAVTDFKIKSSFYGNPGSCGTILELNKEQDVTAVRTDLRLDSLPKSFTFKAF